MVGAKHTPGPWQVGQYFTDDEGYREIAILASVGGAELCPASVVLQFPYVSGMQEANARLIATAPEMIELLVTFTEWARQIAAREDLPRAIRSAAANLHNDGERITTKATGGSTNS